MCGEYARQFSVGVGMEKRPMTRKGPRNRLCWPALEGTSLSSSSISVGGWCHGQPTTYKTQGERESFHLFVSRVDSFLTYR